MFERKTIKDYTKQIGKQYSIPRWFVTLILLHGFKSMRIVFKKGADLQLGLVMKIYTNKRKHAKFRRKERDRTRLNLIRYKKAKQQEDERNRSQNNTGVGTTEAE